jgi:hypothetical protein
VEGVTGNIFTMTQKVHGVKIQKGRRIYIFAKKESPEINIIRVAIIPNASSGQTERYT